MIELPAIPSGTNILGVGIDQIEVSRIQDSIDRNGDHFLNKIFSSNEQEYCKSKSNPAPFFAARFAAKEAMSKAFGTGFGKEFGWLDAEVAHGSLGEPILKLSKNVEGMMKEKGATKALVSLTHLNDIASSIVLLVSS